MRTDNQRPSDNFQDRGGSGGGGGGIGAMALFGIFRLLGLRGMLILIVILAVVYFFNPFGLRDAIFGSVAGSGGQPQVEGEGTCAASAEACDFSRRILGSTETVWAQQFQEGRLPNYGAPAGAYRNPTLVVYSGNVNTDGCGGASSAVGPFYCPGDTNLYVDPSFYETMQSRLNAPGDFAQAYVIAHEVGHHVQNLIGSMQRSVPGETQNQQSVRVELQADCFAGVWGRQANNLAIDQSDVAEAINAANSIGDDRLGARSDQYTHGTSAQRARWFQRGFDSGDARQCDTFAVRDYRQL